MHKLLLFPDGSAEMPPVQNDGAGENAPLCCDEIALKYHGGQILLRHRCNVPPVHNNHKCGAIFIYRCNRLVKNEWAGTHGWV